MTPDTATHRPGFTAPGIRRPTSTWTTYVPPARRVQGDAPAVVFARGMAALTQAAEDHWSMTMWLYGVDPGRAA